MERISRYPLQLDPMEMNYLPITFLRDFTNTAPLWSCGSDNNEYFEFEIREKVEDLKDLKVEDCILTATCYICAIEVPKLFFKDHCKSKRHFINKCIAETALDRMKKHLQIKEDCDISNDVSDTYFCPECVVTVSQKDRKSHENLQSHKYLSMFDGLLENLYKIYANESDTKNTQNKADMSHITNSSKSVKLDNDLNNSLHFVDNRSQPDESNVSTESLKLKRYSISDLKGFEVDCDSSDTSIIKTVKSKADFVIKTKKLVSEESEFKSKLISIPLDKDSSENKESIDYVFIDGDNYKCIVCYSTFDRNALNSHINGSRHKMNILSNVHYMMKESGDDLYCIVCCNILENSVLSAREHCKGSHHTMLYKKILRENGIKISRSRIHCELCDKTIPKRNEFVHIYGCKQHHKKKATNSYCSVCDILIPNHEVINHDKSTLHKSKVECGKNIFIDNDKTVCNVITNDKIIVDTSPNEIIPNEPYFCGVCQVNVPNTAKNIDMHKNGAPHRKKTIQYFETIHNQPAPVRSEPNDANNMYYCEICQRSMLNNIDMIIQHNAGASHLKKLKKNEKSLVDLKSSVLKELPKPEDKKTEIICKVCKVKIPNTKMNISEHGKGRVHLNNYKLTLQSENIVVNDNKNFCQPCNIYIENPLKHIEEKCHKNKNKLYLKIKLDEEHTVLQLSVAEESMLVQTASILEQNHSVSNPKTQDLIPSASSDNNQNLPESEKTDSSQSHTASDQSTLILEHDSIEAQLKIIETDTEILSSSIGNCVI